MLRAALVSVVLVGFVGIGPIVRAEDSTQPTDTTNTTELVESTTTTPESTEETISSDAPIVLEVQTDQPPQETESNQPTAEAVADLTTEAATSNSVDQSAESGDSTVVGNDEAGSAITGDANNELDIFNLANSSQSLLGSSEVPVVYINTIEGDATGDIIIDPVALGQPIPSAATTSVAPLYPESNTVTVFSSTAIINDANLDSQSGNALVEANDDAGNAITGDASNDVDIINVANTIIGTGSYFIGILNIYGDLQGDIVIPESLMTTLMQNGSDPSGNTNVNIANLTNIINKTDLVALSGNATVSGNDTAGGATTGDAVNNISILNYTGQHVFTGNTLLIIVNVMGQWLGLLLGSDESNTAAISASANPNNNSMPSEDLMLSISTQTTISNNLSMYARSGDATVANNDNAGSAKTGNAFNTARIMNISNTVVSLANWFGILYINILGNWYGSVVSPRSVSNTPEQSTAQMTDSTTSTPTSTSPATVHQTTIATVATAQRHPSIVSPISEEFPAPETTTLGTEVIQKFSSISDKTTSSQKNSMLWLSLVAIFVASLYGANQAYRLRIVR